MTASPGCPPLPFGASDGPPFRFGFASPDAVRDVVVEGVSEARLAGWAAGADEQGGLVCAALVGEPPVLREALAEGVVSPVVRVVHAR